MKIGCDLPYSNWFVDKIFYRNGVIADFINMDGLRSIMSDLGLVSYQTSKQLSNIEEISLLKKLFISEQESNKDDQFQLTTNTPNVNNNSETLQKQTSLTLSNLSEYDRVSTTLIQR